MPSINALCAELPCAPPMQLGSGISATKLWPDGVVPCPPGLKFRVSSVITKWKSLSLVSNLNSTRRACTTYTCVSSFKRVLLLFLGGRFGSWRLIRSCRLIGVRAVKSIVPALGSVPTFTAHRSVPPHCACSGVEERVQNARQSSERLVHLAFNFMTTSLTIGPFDQDLLRYIGSNRDIVKCNINGRAPRRAVDEIAVQAGAQLRCARRSAPTTHTAHPT